MRAGSLAWVGWTVTICQCIGQGMALVEAQLVLATVFGRCRLHPASDRPVQAEALATLRPRGGLPMIVEAA